MEDYTELSSSCTYIPYIVTKTLSDNANQCSKHSVIETFGLLIMKANTHFYEVATTT